MNTAILPSIIDYLVAMQNPSICLADPELKRCRPALSKHGLPLSWSGNFAVVFQLQSPEGSKYAIKCFYRDPTNLETRYAELDKHLDGHRPGYLIGFQYQQQGILINGHSFPIVRMDWVEGETLDAFLLHNLQRPGREDQELLSAMAQLWHRLATDLERNQLAHGDLQHSNILFTPGDKPGSVKLKLVDYDGVWVPGLTELPSNEQGHKHYQHPKRQYGPLMDRFPHLVIYTTLRSLRVDPRLIKRLEENDHKLLFGREDFEKPDQSQLFQELWDCQDSDIQHLVGHLILACVQPFEETPSLQELVPNPSTGQVRPLTPEQQAKLEEIMAKPAIIPDPKIPLTSEQQMKPKEIPAMPPIIPVPPPLPLKATHAPNLPKLYHSVLMAPLGLAVGCLTGALLGPIYAGLLVMVPFVLIAVLLVLTDKGRWVNVVVLLGVTATAAALFLAAQTGWWWALNCWWFGALLGLVAGGVVAVWHHAAAVSASRAQKQPPTLIRSLRAATAISALLVVSLGWIPNQYGIRPPGFASSWHEARRPTLNLIALEPPKGPIADEPFTIEFSASSPLGRPVHVEWRQVGETEWQRLSEPKLHIPKVKTDPLALEFRAVDSKGFASSVTKQQWEVHAVPTLAVRKQDPAKGPIADEPFTIEFSASSPLGRPVHVEWRQVGEAEWQRLSEPKLHIPKVTTDPVALEFRAVDSKGYASSVMMQAVFPDRESYHCNAVRRLTGHQGWVTSVAVTPDGRYVVSGSDDSTVRVWDWQNGKEARRLTGHSNRVLSVAVTPDGRYVVSGSADSTVRVWDWQNGKEVWRLTGHQSGVTSVAVTPDGRYVVSGSDDWTVRVWDWQNGQEVRRLTGHSNRVLSVAVTPDGRFVISGSDDRTVRVWYIGDLK